jgi:hypothetical protein
MSPRTVAAVAVALYISSDYGTGAPLKYLAFASGLSILIPWFLSRKALSLDPTVAIGGLLILAAILASGGLFLLALTSLAILLPSGLIAGSYLAESGLARLAASGSVAITQWMPVVSQHQNPYLILSKLGRHQFGTDYTQTTLAQIGNLRPVGTTVSPGLVAFLLLAAIALTMVKGGTTQGERVVLRLLAIGHSYCLVLTGSRTGIASLAILLAWIWGRSQRIGFPLRIFSLLIGCFGVAFLSESSSRVAPETRLDIIRAALPALRSHWFFGVGWGQTPKYVSTVADGVVYHLHFFPLHILFELGVLGILGFLLLTFYVGKRSILAIAILAPFALADAGVFINPTTILFLGVVIGVTLYGTPSWDASREAFPAISAP